MKIPTELNNRKQNHSVHSSPADVLSFGFCLSLHRQGYFTFCAKAFS